MSARLVALTQRRVPDVAFFDDDSESTVTIETPNPPAGGAAPPVRPELPEFSPPEFTPPPPPTRSPEAERAFQHALAAMEGRLPIPKALTIDLDRQQGILSQSLAKSLGPSWKTDAAGVMVMGEFAARRTQIEDAARHGNPALTANLLEGLIREDAARNAFQNQAALAQFQASAAAGLEAYQAEVAASLEAYRTANRPAGVTRETTRSGGEGGSLLTPIAGTLGIGAAMLLGGKRPWWLPDSEKDGGTATSNPMLGLQPDEYDPFGAVSDQGLPGFSGPAPWEIEMYGGAGTTSPDVLGLGDFGGYGGDFNISSLGYYDPAAFDFDAFDFGGFSVDPSVYDFQVGGLDFGSLDIGYGTDFDFAGGGFSLPDLSFEGWGYL